MSPVRVLAWIELKLFAREPVTVVFTLALPPLVLYVLSEVFGDTPDPSGDVFRGVGGATYYLPAYIGLVVASLGVIGLPVHLAAYRERGVLRRFPAARVPPRRTPPTGGHRHHGQRRRRQRRGPRTGRFPISLCGRCPRRTGGGHRRPAGG